MNLFRFAAIYANSIFELPVSDQRKIIIYTGVLFERHQSLHGTIKQTQRFRVVFSLPLKINVIRSKRIFSLTF